MQYIHNSQGMLRIGRQLKRVCTVPYSAPCNINLGVPNSGYTTQLIFVGCAVFRYITMSLPFIASVYRQCSSSRFEFKALFP